MIVEKEKPDFEVAIVGAGFAGLACAIRLLKEGRKSFVIFERADEVGGTWRDNVYPGCACDVPSHLYSFSFAQNPNWSRAFSPQKEIWAYMKDCVKRFGLKDFLRFNNEIREIILDEDKGFWTLTNQRGEKITSKTVVCALGPLNKPSIPNFEGINTFQGSTFHTAEWDTSYDFKGKNVAVIGTGASVIQLVPELAKEVKNLYLFQRTAPWVLPKMDGNISAFMKFVFKNIPFTQRLFRHTIYWLIEFFGLSFLGNKSLSKRIEKNGLQHIQNTIKDPALQEALTPHFKPGCKRILFSNEYYPALNQDNVQLITGSIEHIHSNSIQTKNGQELGIDAIVWGTGFSVSDYLIDLGIVGREGKNLAQEWKNNGPEAYVGTTISGFPSIFFMFGPNTAGGHNSIIHIIESQTTYIIDYLKKLDRLGQGILLDVKPEAQRIYNDNIQELLKKTVWSSGCKSWYLTESGKNTTIFPGLNHTFRKLTKRVKMKDYESFKVSKTKEKLLEQVSR